MKEKPISLQDNFEKVNVVPNTESDCSAFCILMSLSHNLSFNTKATIFWKENEVKITGVFR